MKYYHIKRGIINFTVVVTQEYLCTYPNFYGEKPFRLDPGTYRLISYMQVGDIDNKM
jgi:hypothetical protein